MGNIVGNALRLSGAGSTDALRLDTAPEGMKYQGIRLNVSCPVTITGTPTLVTADLVAFLRRCIGSLTLEEGPKAARRLIHAAVDGQDLRTMHRWYMLNEVTNNVVGTQAAGAATLTATVFLPFTPPPYLRGGSRYPGTTQVRSMLLRCVEGSAAIVASVARAAGNVTVEVEYACEPGPDAWAPVVSMQRESSPRRDATGPDGVTLLCYVPDTAAASSALTAFNLQIGARRVTDLQAVASVTRAYTDEVIDQGGTGIVDDNTVLYYAGPGAEVDQLAHGPLRFEEAKSDLSPVNLRFVYLPSREPGRAKAEAKASADALGGSVLLTQPVIGEDADPGAAATQAARVFTPSDARFTSKPGLLAASGSDVVGVSIPPLYVQSVSGQAAAAKGAGPAAARDVAKRGIKVVSLAVPGATATDGARKGDVAEGVAKSFGSIG